LRSFWIKKKQTANQKNTILFCFKIKFLDKALKKAYLFAILLL